MLNKPKIIFQIEQKSEITLNKYSELREIFSRNYKLLKKDTIKSIRYRPHDLRIRQSYGNYEIVWKSGDPVNIIRKKIIIPISHKYKLKYFEKLFESLGYYRESSWKKHREIYKFSYKSNDYYLELQNIEDFGYVLEVYHECDKDESNIHLENISAILDIFHCKPINSDDFIKKRNIFIENEKKESFVN